MIAGILFLTVFVVGLIVGSIMARRKHPPVDSARFGAAVQHLYGARGYQARAVLPVDEFNQLFADDAD